MFIFIFVGLVALLMTPIAIGVLKTLAHLLVYGGF